MRAHYYRWRTCFAPRWVCYGSYPTMRDAILANDPFQEKES